MSTVNTDIKEVVKQRYGQAASRLTSGKIGCCGSGSALASSCDPITSDLYTSRRSVCRNGRSGFSWLRQSDRPRRTERRRNRPRSGSRRRHRCPALGAARGPAVRRTGSI